MPDPPSWLTDGRFWYRRTVRGGAEFVIVDPATATKRPLFDHARLAAALSSATHVSYTATTLPFATLTLVGNLQAIEFGSPRWRCTLSDYACVRISTATESGDANGRRGGRDGRAGLGPNAAVDSVRTSPDGKTDATIDHFNVFIRHKQAPASSAIQLTNDGTEGERLHARVARVVAGLDTRSRYTVACQAFSGRSRWSSRRRRINCSRRSSRATTASPATRSITISRC